MFEFLFTIENFLELLKGDIELLFVMEKLLFVITILRDKGLKVLSFLYVIAN